MSKSALLLDSNSLFARSWYAADSAGNKGLTCQFMLRTLLDIITDRSRTGSVITHALCAWDGASKNDKNRGEKPEGYYDAMNFCSKTIKTLLGIEQCCLPTEGEDQVATAAWNCCNSGFESVIVASGDKDLKQLSGMFGKVRYYCLNSKDIANERLICSKLGVRHPSHIGIALAITGDHSDNIKGVPGWGPAKVRKIFADFDKDSDLAQIAESIISMLKPEHVDNFMRDMDLTVLNTNVEGVPSPSVIRMASSDDFISAGFSSLSYYPMQYGN